MFFNESECYKMTDKRFEELEKMNVEDIENGLKNKSINISQLEELLNEEVITGLDIENFVKNRVINVYDLVKLAETIGLYELESMFLTGTLNVKDLGVLIENEVFGAYRIGNFFRDGLISLTDMEYFFANGIIEKKSVSYFVKAGIFDINIIKHFLKNGLISGNEIKNILRSGSFSIGDIIGIVEYEKFSIEEIKKIVDDISWDVSDIYEDLPRTGLLKSALLMATNNVEFINNYINREILDDKEKKLIVFLMEHPKVELAEYIYPLIGFLNLPEEMSIGIEIESEGRQSNYIMDCPTFGGWTAKSDLSLTSGVELTSPILHPTKESVKKIYLVNEVLDLLGQTTSERCGGHIHIGADYLTSVKSYINLIEIWCNVEKILYTITNNRFTPPRDDISEFAIPIAYRVQRALENGVITPEDDFRGFIKQLQDFQDEDRSFGLNFLNVNTRKNTIEFRIANGTLNPSLWIENINLFGGIVAVSEELSKIQEKSEKDTEDLEKLQLFEKLKTEIPEQEKLDILLNLIGEHPNTYKTRYKANMEFTNEKKIFSRMKKPIVILDNAPKITLQDILQVTKDVSDIEQHKAMDRLIRDKKRTLNKGNER